MGKRSTKITKDGLSRFTEQLKALPIKEQTTFSNREAVAQYKDLILHVVHTKGYSIQDIAELLSEQGTTISPSTLASYLRQVKKKPGTSKKKTSIASTPRTPTKPEQFDTHSPLPSSGAIDQGDR